MEPSENTAATLSNIDSFKRAMTYAMYETFKFAGQYTSTFTMNCPDPQIEVGGTTITLPYSSDDRMLMHSFTEPVFKTMSHFTGFFSVSQDKFRLTSEEFENYLQQNIFPRICETIAPTIPRQSLRLSLRHLIVEETANQTFQWHASAKQDNSIASVHVILPTSYEAENVEFDFGPCYECHNLSGVSASHGATLAWRDGVHITMGKVQSGMRVALSYVLEQESEDPKPYLYPALLLKKVTDFEGLLEYWNALLADQERAKGLGNEVPGYLLIPVKDCLDFRDSLELYTLLRGDLQRVLAIRNVCESNGLDIAFVVVHRKEWKHKRSDEQKALPAPETWLEGRSLHGLDLPWVHLLSFHESHLLRDASRIATMARYEEPNAETEYATQTWYQELGVILYSQGFVEALSDSEVKVPVSESSPRLEPSTSENFSRGREALRVSSLVVPEANLTNVLDGLNAAALNDVPTPGEKAFIHAALRQPFDRRLQFALVNLSLKRKTYDTWKLSANKSDNFWSAADLSSEFQNIRAQQALETFDNRAIKTWLSRRLDRAGIFSCLKYLANHANEISISKSHTVGGRVYSYVEKRLSTLPSITREHAVHLLPVARGVEFARDLVMQSMISSIKKVADNSDFWLAFTQQYAAEFKVPSSFPDCLLGECFEVLATRPAIAALPDGSFCFPGLCSFELFIRFREVDPRIMTSHTLTVLKNFVLIGEVPRERLYPYYSTTVLPSLRGTINKYGHSITEPRLAPLFAKMISDYMHNMLSPVPYLPRKITSDCASCSILDDFLISAVLTTAIFHGSREELDHLVGHLDECADLTTYGWQSPLYDRHAVVVNKLDGSRTGPTPLPGWLRRRSAAIAFLEAIGSWKEIMLLLGDHYNWLIAALDGRLLFPPVLEIAGEWWQPDECLEVLCIKGQWTRSRVFGLS